MKNILLATTALVVTAGFASAEVTFSGRGEAGVYRLAPAAAVAVKAGVQADGAATDTTVIAYAPATASKVALTSGTAIARTASTGTEAPATTGTIAAALEDLNNAKALVAALEASASQGTGVDTGAIAGFNMETYAGTTDIVNGVGTAANTAIRKDLLNGAKALLAQAQLVYDTQIGTAAVAAGATPDTKAYSGYDLDVKVSGASDNGMTFSMGFDIGAGQIADSTDDLAMDNMGTTFVAEELVIGYNGYTVKIGDNLIDDLYDDTQNGDVSLSGTIGALSFGIVTDMDKDTAAVTASTVYTDSATKGADTLVTTAAVKAVWETTSYSLGYKAGDVAFSLVGTDGNDNVGEAAMKVSASAPLGDFKFTASIDNKGKADDIAKLAVSYTTGGLTLTASSADDANHSLSSNKDGKASYDVGLSYAMGAATVQYNTDESAAWWANASYNLGGGANAFATIDHTDFAVAGVKFTF